MNEYNKMEGVTGKENEKLIKLFHKIIRNSLLEYRGLKVEAKFS